MFKKRIHTFGLTCGLAVLALSANAGSVGDGIVTETTVSGLHKGDTSFKIEFLGLTNTGLTWNYKVSEVTGSDLSHFVIGFCDDLTLSNIDIQSVSHTPFSFGSNDGGQGTGVYGLKFDGIDEAFVMGEFSFTLDAVYEVVNGQVGFKTGGRTKTGVGTIAAPGCDECGPPVLAPTPTAAAAGLIGLGLIGMRRRRA